MAGTSNEEIKIRIATPGDEAEIANVHLNSWREARTMFCR